MIKDDYLIEAYELLLTYCEDLIQSAGLIINETTLDSELVTPVKSLLYGCGRIEAPELERLREQLVAKFGPEFCSVTSDSDKADVDPRLVVKLGIRNPDARLSDQYMMAIASSYGIAFKTADSDVEKALPSASHTASTTPALSVPSPANVAETLPPPPPYPKPASDNPSFEELTKRFLELKQR